MAYAELAGLPPITGLYTSILCLIGYALFGPSKILVLGPDSSLGPMIAATILPLVGAHGDPARAVALASMLALLVGAMTVLAGIARLGFVADLLSKPTMIGYMNGLALTILVGQLPKLFGFSVEGDNFVAELRGFAKGRGQGETVPAALAIGLVGLVLILACQRLAAEVSRRAGRGRAVHPGRQRLRPGRPRGRRWSAPCLKAFPPSPSRTLPSPISGCWSAGAFGIAVVSLADTISTASSFAARSGEEIDGSREMIGIGAANIAAGFFQGFPVSTSGSRTAVAEQAGAKTQVTGLVGALAIIVMLADRARSAAQPAPADTGRGGDRRRHVAGRHRGYRPAVPPATGRVLPCPSPPSSAWRCSGVLPGIAHRRRPVGLERVPSAVVALPCHPRPGPGHRRIPRRAQLPQAAQRLPGCVIFRFDAPLIFANARTFREHIRALAGAEPPPAWIIVAAEPITDVDTTAADMLEDLDQALNERGISLVFAEMKDPVRQKIDRYGLTRTIDPDHFFPTLDDAIAAFRAQSDAEWGSRRAFQPAVSHRGLSSAARRARRTRSLDSRICARRASSTRAEFQRAKAKILAS